MVKPIIKPTHLDIAPSKIRRGRNTGKLAHIKDMPLDIVFEITSYLTPLDLFHLTWVSKHFRALLMSKSRRHLWAVARQNCRGMPDPHSGLSEPRYAALIFVHSCFSCGATRARKEDYALAVRFCMTCWRENVRKGSTLVREYKEVLKKDTTIFTLLPCVGSDTLPGSSCYYYVPEFRNVVTEYIARPDDNAKNAYIEERRRYVVEVKEFCQKLRVWVQGEKREQERIKDRREESIKQKLRELGYSPADFPRTDPDPYFGNKRWYRIVRQPRELTPQIWNRIKPKLEKILADERGCRELLDHRYRLDTREIELLSAYKHYLPTAPVDDGPFPTRDEVRHLPAVQALLDEDHARMPVTAERLLTVVPALREHARKTKAQLVQAAWDHIVERSRASAREAYWLDEFNEAYVPRTVKGEVDLTKLKGVPEGMRHGAEEVLGLATVLFKCYLCVDCDGWPIEGSGVYNATELARHLHTQHAKDGVRRGRIEVDDTLARKVLNLLSLPEDAMYSDVSGRVVCTCSTFKPGSTFAELLSHIIWETSFHSSVQECKWASEIPDAETFVDNHAFEKSTEPFIKLLADGETLERPALTDTEQDVLRAISEAFGEKKVVCGVCRASTTIVKPDELWNEANPHASGPTVLRPREMEHEELVRHVKAKHLREATQDDARSPPPSNW